MKNILIIFFKKSLILPEKYTFGFFGLKNEDQIFIQKADKFTIEPGTIKVLKNSIIVETYLFIN